MFKEDKKNCLARKDLSREGKVDDAIKDLVALINEKEDFYTTSSCAGRIVVIKVPESGKKHEAEWLLKRHDPVTLKQVTDSLKKLPKESVWFRQESAILHIACKDLENATKMLTACKEVGFKRSGIISAKHFILEIMGTEKVDTIIAKEGNLLVDNDYLDILVDIANKRMEKNRERLKKLEKLVKKL